VAQFEGQVAERRQARDLAGEALGGAVAGVEAALAALDDYDQAERELDQALLVRDRAAAAEAQEARRLAGVLERRLRLTEQRDDAIRVIEQIETGGPARRSAELRGQIADMEAGLARADAEQSRAERAAEATLHQARLGRVAATAELERVDRTLRADLPGVPEAPAQQWPPGPPLPVLMAERRDSIAAVLAGRYQARSVAKAAMDEAGEGLRAAERELAEARQAVVSIEAAALLQDLVAVADLREAGAGITLVCDEAFRAVNSVVVTAVVEHLTGSQDVQVVILTEDAAILGWAATLAPEMGAMAVPTEAPNNPSDASSAQESDLRGSATITPLRPAPSDRAEPSAALLPTEVPRPASVPAPHSLRLPGHTESASPIFKETLRNVSTYP
jgi:hypothetical protein